MGPRDFGDCLAIRFPPLYVGFAVLPTVVPTANIVSLAYLEGLIRAHWTSGLRTDGLGYELGLGHELGYNVYEPYNVKFYHCAVDARCF